MRTVTLHGADHFYNTMATPELADEVLTKVQNAETEHGYIIVTYSDEGYCIFEVLGEDENEIDVEFTGTAC